MGGGTDVTEEQLHRLVVRAADGDDAAWGAMWEHLEPWLSAFVAQPRFLRRLGQREQDRRNIVIDVIARMRANRFERLRLYLEVRCETPGIDLRTWLSVVARRAGIEYARGDRSPDGQVSGGISALFAHAASALCEPYLSALELWVQGLPLDAIAAELGLESEGSTHAIVVQAIAQLTRRAS